MKKACVSIVLHSHMPFIRHPEIKDAMEERWLFEAMSECYIPLIEVYDNLIKDKIDFKITMSITPTLMFMLEDEYLNKRYTEYITKSIKLSQKEIIRSKNDKSLNELAQFYNERFNNLMKIYKSYQCNLMNAFKKFEKLGYLEIITCAATHGLLPLLMVNPETVKAQIATGVQSYIDCIGHGPKGIWLPECAYTYSLESILKEFGINYFISESKAILNASPKPKYGTYAPIAMPNGVCTFGRDMESSYQVWSDFMGYPGDFNYREFYKDIGYELPEDYLKPYMNEDGIRLDTGIKYYKITGKTDKKEYYNREAAMEKIKEHAKHFALSRHKQISSISDHMEQTPIIVCPYDTELFGHWWFEGPDFINEFIRVSSEEWTNYKLTTPSEYLLKYPMVQCCSPSPSSWGENSDFSVWINSSNHWIYRDVHQCAEDMIRLANTYSNPTELQKRALNQSARELMLAESSDWPFIIKNNTTVEYAVKRVNTHVERFNKLYEDITKNSIDIKYLSRLEEVDNVFTNINYNIYKPNVY
jgi:1,4-alpha-glucan branching enzyme